MRQQTLHEPVLSTLPGAESSADLQEAASEAAGLKKITVTELIRERLLTKVGLADGNGMPDGAGIIEGRRRPNGILRGARFCD